MRIPHQWHKEHEREMRQVAQSLAFNSWKITRKVLKSMQDEKFRFTSYKQGLEVTAEFLIFLTQVTDRLVYDSMENETRAEFIGAMAGRVVEMLLDNYQDLPPEDQAHEDYRAVLVAQYNQCANDYAGFSYGSDGPSYHFLRYLGERVGKIMGDDQENRWAIDQVMEIEAPQTIDELKKSLAGLLGITA